MNNAMMNDVTAKLHQLKYNGAAKPNKATNNKTIINFILYDLLKTNLPRLFFFDAISSFV